MGMADFGPQVEQAINRAMLSGLHEHLLRCGVATHDLGEWTLGFTAQLSGAGQPVWTSVVTVRWQILAEVRSVPHPSLKAYWNKRPVGEDLTRYVREVMDTHLRPMVAALLQRKAVLVGCRRWLIDAAKAELARLAAETRATLAGADWPRLYGGGVWVWNPNSQMDEMILTWMNDFRQFVLQVSQPGAAMMGEKDFPVSGACVGYHTSEWRRYEQPGSRWPIGSVDDISDTCPWGREWWLHLIRHVYALITQPLSLDESAEIMKLSALDLFKPCDRIEIQPGVYVENTDRGHGERVSTKERGIYGRQETVAPCGFSPAARTACTVGGLSAGADDCAGQGGGGGGGKG